MGELFSICIPLIIPVLINISKNNEIILYWIICDVMYK
jgi:hypothetical protein